jgi:hypothetical protein
MGKRGAAKVTLRAEQIMNIHVSIFGYKEEKRKGKTRSSDPKPNGEISCQWVEQQRRKDSMHT